MSKRQTLTGTVWTRDCKSGCNATAGTRPRPTMSALGVHSSSRRRQRCSIWPAWRLAACSPRRLTSPAHGNFRRPSRHYEEKWVYGDDHEHDLSAPTAPEARTRKSWTVGLPATLKRWWVAYITWRIEQAAIAQLWKMSDREFKDIGLTRSAITCGLRGEGGARPANPSDVAEQTRARKRLP